MNGYATAGGGAMITITDGIMWMMSPGRGDLPVGQLDAQKRLPKGSGMPSFASSWFMRAAENI